MLNLLNNAITIKASDIEILNRISYFSLFFLFL